MTANAHAEVCRNDKMYWIKDEAWFEKLKMGNGVVLKWGRI